MPRCMLVLKYTVPDHELTDSRCDRQHYDMQSPFCFNIALVTTPLPASWQRSRIQHPPNELRGQREVGVESHKTRSERWE